MTDFLAHSAKNNFPAQTYKSHIEGVVNLSTDFVNEVAQYAPKFAEDLKQCVTDSAKLHDLGKLDDKNQKVLRGEEYSSYLPIRHAEAGVEIYKQNSHTKTSAIVIASHHTGLPDISERTQTKEAWLRDDKIENRRYINESIPELIKRHNLSVPENLAYNQQESFITKGPIKYHPVFLRMALSCLVDADHSDTARAYGQEISEEIPKLRAKERLAQLDDYIQNINLNSSNSERNKLRQDLYYSCKDALVKDNFVFCTSPVGSGKTTAIMAHLLKQAELRKAKRIFVVLPFTNIISQSVAIYRKALVLPGENPQEVVAELHCKADFEDSNLRHLTALWRAPIIVTTAVAFFETLASRHPSTLRRYHELPGSVIFLDEAHCALPLRLFPLAWQWMNEFADNWHCYWVLGSGSLVRFWELDGFNELRHDVKLKQPAISELVSKELLHKLQQYELNRVKFCYTPKRLSCDELINWVHQFSGPRLIVMNTIQNAAVIANLISKKYGRDKVEHLSTALTAQDREETIARIKKRLADPEDQDWTLVATSCIEAGMDFSFKVGFRELSSLLSLLQMAGRINRHGLDSNASVWCFSMQDHSLLTKNPEIKYSAEILYDYFNRGETISSELCTKALNQELKIHDNIISKVNELIFKENYSKFKYVEDNFKVIDQDTVTVIVDEKLAQMIKNGQGSWQQIQRKSFSIRRSKIISDKANNKGKYQVEEISKDLYLWQEEYDSFLGYMKGIVNKK